MAKSKNPPSKSTTVKKRGTVAARESRRQRIASGVVAGVPIDAIAQAEGISREWASHEAHAPETRLAIATLLDRHYQAAAELIPEALGVIRSSLSAAQFAIQKLTTVDLLSKVRQDRTVIVEVGPDHYARLAGVKRLIELLTAGRPALKEAEPQNGLATLEELRSVLLAKTPLQ